MPKRYAPEFRSRIVDRVRAGHSSRSVAREVGLADQTVYRWVNQEAVDRGERAGVRSEDVAELQRAQRRIRELETELALVRRASELFAEGKARPKGSSR